MQQENNIKQVKNVIKGLWAGKSDNAMVRVSQAAPGIENIVEAFQLSLSLRPVGNSQKHFKKSSLEDLNAVLTILRDERPYQIRQGREIGLDMNDTLLKSVNKQKFDEHLVRNARRAMRPFRIDFDEEE